MGSWPTVRCDVNHAVKVGSFDEPRHAVDEIRIAETPVKCMCVLRERVDSAEVVLEFSTHGTEDCVRTVLEQVYGILDLLLGSVGHEL